MKLFDEFPTRRDEFQILVVHDSTVQSLAEMDEHLKSSVERWGRVLPFPILLDDGGATFRTFGIRHYPTHVLIDPKGRITKKGECFLRDHLLRTDRSVAGLLDRLASASVTSFAHVVSRVAAQEHGDFALRDFAQRTARSEQVQAIAKALVEIGGEEAAVFFCGKFGIESSVRDTRLRAVRALGRLGSSSVLSSLHEVLEKEEDSEIERALRVAIKQIEARR